MKRGKPIPSRRYPDRKLYIVDMKRTVGTQGERHVQIVVEKNTSEVVSAYLWESHETL